MIFGKKMGKKKSMYEKKLLSSWPTPEPFRGGGVHSKKRPEI